MQQSLCNLQKELTQLILSSETVNMIVNDTATQNCVVEQRWPHKLLLLAYFIAVAWYAAVAFAPHIADLVSSDIAVVFARPINYLDDPNFNGVYAPAQQYNNGMTHISGEIAECWQDNSSWANITVNYSKDAISPHTGNVCQCIDVKSLGSGGSANAAQLMQYQTLPAGRYQASVWARTDGNKPITLIISSNNETIAQQEKMVGRNWTKLAIRTGLIDQGSTTLLIQSGGIGKVWVDDATLEPLQSPVPLWRIIIFGVALALIFYGLRLLRSRFRGYDENLGGLSGTLR